MSPQTKQPLSGSVDVFSLQWHSPDSMPPQFEYDLLKSLSNWFKHGISLADAENLWLDPRKQYVRALPTVTETRYGLIATHQGETWHVAFTTRHGRYRLISCRRARKKEVAAYQRR